MSDLEGLKKSAPGAVVAALNRSMGHAATKTKKYVAERYEIQQRFVKDAMKMRNAAKNTFEARIDIKGHVRSMTRFKTKPAKPPVQKGVPIHARKATQVKIKKTEGFKVVKGIPGAFIQTMNNATNVWRRQSKYKNDLKVLRSLSVPQMVENPIVVEKIRQSALEMIDKRLTHENEYRLNRMIAIN
jgi:hypothetical protein